MKEDSIEIKLIDEVSQDNITNIGSDLGEIALDSLFEDGVLKDIPVIGSITGLVKATINIREKIFAKKILKFLISLKDIPSEKRKAFVEEIDNEKGFKKKVGEAVIVLLEKIDDVNKAEILGNLFKAYVLNKLTYNDFVKISSALGNVNYSDLNLFARYYNEKKTLPTLVAEELAFNGLMSISIAPQKMTMDMTELKQELVYQINVFGRNLIEFGFLTRVNKK